MRIKQQGLQMRGELSLVATVEQKTGATLFHEPRYAADSGSNNRKPGGPGLEDRERSSFRTAGQSEQIHCRQIVLGMRLIANEVHTIGEAQVIGQSLEFLSHRTVADQQQMSMPVPWDDRGERSNEPILALHLSQPSNRSDHDGTSRNSQSFTNSGTGIRTSETIDIDAIQNRCDFRSRNGTEGCQ